MSHIFSTLTFFTDIFFAWKLSQHLLGAISVAPPAHLAQSAERKTFNLVVVGSTPTVGTSSLV